MAEPPHVWRLTEADAAAAGTVLARAFLDEPVFVAAFPWGTLLINVSGSFVLGFYLTLVTERFVGRSTTRLFLATGFLGAYTTFSTFSYETVQLVAAGASLSALAYVVGSRCWASPPRSPASSVPMPSRTVRDAPR